MNTQESQYSLSSSVPLGLRRILFISLFAVIFFVTAGWRLTPGLMADEIAAQVQQVLGLDVELDDITLGTDFVVLSNLWMATPEGDLELEVETLRMGVDLVALTQRAAGAIHGIRMERPRLAVDLRQPAAAERLKKLRRLLGERGSEEAVEPTESSAEGLDRGSLEFLLALVRDGSAFEVSGAVVTVIEEDTEKDLLRNVDGVLVKRDRRHFELDGTGEHGEGRLAWALGADLETFVVEGDAQWAAFPVDQVLRLLPNLPIIDPEVIRTDGKVRWTLEANRRFAVAGRASVKGLEVRANRLAQQTIRDLSATAEGSAVLDLSESSLVIEQARIERRGAVGELVGEAHWSEDSVQLDLEAKLPRSPCDKVIGAIPAGLLGHYDTFDLRGQMAGRLVLQVNSSRPSDTELEIDIEDDCEFEQVPPRAEVERYRKPFFHVVRGHDGEIVHEFETGPGTLAWAPIEEVSPFFLHAVLAHEDAGFFRHTGFAVYAMESALERNLRQERFAFGASTVTMQLAKNLFLTRDKTLSRKAQETLLTWWLERELSKREILELYVNIIEYGPEIFGIRQAAEHYFGREPLHLTPAESVFLATLLPAPVPRARQLEENRLWPATEREIRFLLRHMMRRDRIDQVALDHGLRQLENFSFFQGERHLADPIRPAVSELGQPGELPFETLYALWKANEEHNTLALDALSDWQVVGNATRVQTLYSDSPFSDSSYSDSSYSDSSLE